VLGNGRRLGQVIGNLLDNAVKFTPAGGRVVLRACVREDDLCVEVSDNGPGIPAADLPHVFEAFFRVRQTAQEIPGTGLGLSIASSIVEAHNGRIWAESTEGEGATFSFCIPLCKGGLGPAMSP
jgi:signal transduction histidine kinase